MHGSRVSAPLAIRLEYDCDFRNESFRNRVLAVLMPSRCHFHFPSSQQEIIIHAAHFLAFFLVGILHHRSTIIIIVIIVIIVIVGRLLRLFFRRFLCLLLRFYIFRKGCHILLDRSKLPWQACCYTHFRRLPTHCM